MSGALEYAVYSRRAGSMVAAFVVPRDARTWATCHSLTGDTCEVWRIRPQETKIPPARIIAFRGGKVVA